MQVFSNSQAYPTCNSQHQSYNLLCRYIAYTRTFRMIFEGSMTFWIFSTPDLKFSAIFSAAIVKSLILENQVFCTCTKKLRHLCHCRNTFEQ
ncbi:hypothetical protein FGO68_gene509 [Halteria grandinella]|uniref:Uncharacterized protein n=1 Tax=Halteria grandinella TaxID=5974 RepID=A0A8J8P6H3_HALGN|nr:hypothetical protein FGO68_gene509 [Halteria grandinella]